jgi:hypothetical protein
VVALSALFILAAYTGVHGRTAMIDHLNAMATCVFVAFFALVANTTGGGEQ